MDADPLGDGRILGEPEVKIPALLSTQNTASAAASINADQVWPEIIVNSSGVFTKQANARSPICGVAVDANDSVAGDIESRRVAVSHAGERYSVTTVPNEAVAPFLKRTSVDAERQPAAIREDRRNDPPTYDLVYKGMAAFPSLALAER